MILFYPTLYEPEVIRRKSKLRKAWSNYYDKIGLAANKKRIKVSMRVRKGKFPPK